MSDSPTQVGGGKPSLEAEALRLFTESLDQPAADRAAWISGRCGDRPALWRRVMALVEADESADGFLEQPAPAVRAPDRSGERLGAFELVESLAIGGMSAVYRARRVDGAFDHEVAIKLFDAAHVSGTAMERFEAERRILARLDHPGIARIIDGGAAGDGTPYVVMELVRGEPITRYCERHAVDVAGRLELVRRVCEALQAAHRLGIVHRDIKAGNVLVDERGQPRLIDFGIAKVLSPDPGPAALAETRIDQRLMTPEYASPEQIRGEATGIPSDVYSLGVLLYELLTGRRPHQVAGLSPAELERVVCDTLPQDPSKAVGQRRAAPAAGFGGPDRLARSLRGDVDRIVMTALRREPGLRYTSAAALADDVERHLSGQPVAARGASRIYRAGKFIQRHRSGALATATVFAVLLTSLVIVAIQAEQARREAARAEAAKEFLVRMISQADPYENTEAPTIAGAVKRAIPSIGETFAGEPALEAEMRHATGFALAGLGDLETARAQLEQALALYEQVGSVIERAEVLNALAGVSWGEAEYEQADPLYERAMALVENDPSPEGRETAFKILIDWAGLMPKMDRGERGVELALRAVEMVDALPEVDPLDHAVLYNNLAASFDAMEDYDKAIIAYEKSIELHRRHSDAHPDLATALGNLGLTYELVGEMDKAVETVARAVAMQRDLLGEDHPQYVLMRYNLGSLQINAGQLERAAENLEAAVAAAGEAYPDNHLYIGRFNHRLGAVYYQLDRPERARVHVDAAQSIYAAREDVPESWRTDLELLAAER